MNISDKAYKAATDAILEDHKADEPHLFAAASLKAAAPIIAAKSLRDAANYLATHLEYLKDDKTAWLARSNDIGLLLARAEGLDPQ